MGTKLWFQSLLISLSLVFFGLDMLLVWGECQINQETTLIRLKNNLHFDSSLSTKLVSWNPNTTDCCTWGGVTCSTNGEVIGLDLSNEMISDVIDDSSVLFDLVNLESLNLAENSFSHSPLPSKIGNLTGLLYLNLSNSNFSDQIPGELSQLTKLEVLDLSFGLLELEKPNLANLIQNLTRLTSLYLDDVDLSTQNSDWCRALSSSLLNLEVVSLSYCKLSGPLDDSLKELKSLSVIRLDGNNLSVPVPDFFADFKNLTVMNLAYCNLIGTFPSKVLQLPNLQSLYLRHNENLYGSLPSFPVNGSLQSLVVSNTKFSGGIPESIGNLKNLSRIELWGSNFSGGIPESIQNLTQLEYIDLSNNSLSGMVPSGHFKNLENLVYVDLSSNGLEGSIPTSLFTLQNLQQIRLSDNNFYGLLPNISNPLTSSLDTLVLDNNKLEGEIPKSIFELGKLNALYLSSNNLSAALRIIDFEDHLSTLMYLDLSFNNVSIITSDNITLVNHFPKFMTLRLASCNLLTFPNLGNQSRLTVLDLSNNKIEGKIPNWVWKVGNGNLQYMNLSHNRLTGFEEPYSFPDLGFLNMLDLHSNHLSGVIPFLPQTARFIDYSNNLFNSSLSETIGGNLSSAFFFSVSNNLLTGVIPQSICNAFYLEVLDMSNNQFKGSIPNCLVEFSNSLGVLNLANNSLSGRIEGTFPSDCGLNTLDLHGNSLEGEIPESLVNCTMLRVLNLGNNMINDTYPCSLVNNTDLHVLVLRSNKLHGSVLCGQNQHNKWSKLQILDIAHNSFSGTLPADFFLQWDAMMTEEIGESNKHLNFYLTESNVYYYQDTVTVTTKGLELKLVKILTIFTSIDISNNQFSGEIPCTTGQLKALYILNVSHNEFTGSIPPSLGNMTQLESLDMSSNKLTGEIPNSLANLSFLSVMNMSYNQLRGRIPTGNQLQTFENNSYFGNERLCGFPLSRSCTSSSKSVPNSQESGNENDWRSIYYGFGFGMIISVLFSLWKGY